jgi:hypothetical protein
MKIEIQFPALEAAKNAMGASHVEWVSIQDALTAPDFMIELSETGIEITLDQVKSTDDGLLSYRGQQILLYIKDTRQDHHTLLYDKKKSRRFHIADKCETLEKMRFEKRYERYVVTNRRDGKFLVDAMSKENRAIEEIEAPLCVCKNCLKALNYRDYPSLGYSQQAEVWNFFSIENFFEEHSTSFHKIPKFTDINVPSQYSESWKSISNKCREQAGWTCQKCAVNLITQKNLLHAHHKNGVKGDNSPSNLQPLCISCHQNEPGHRGMYVSAADLKAVKYMRIEQMTSDTL